MSFISSVEIINVVVPKLYIFFWIHTSIAEAAAVIPNGAKIFFYQWNCYLKTAVVNNEGKTLRMSLKLFDGNDLPH